ncbi:MAG: hypothetical protein LC792_09750, partial [Actinobacteria bacterium]|nr:hypothetical protein [Actinomycetota bacterium]
YGWVLVGSARTGSTSQAALARIDLYGNLVGGFGAGGKVLADFGPGDDEARSVATDNAKNLIVAGQSGDAAVIARYTPSGALDPGFGTGGVVRLDLSPGEDVVQRILFDPNGYVVVAGTAGNRGFVAQLGADGRLDPTFGKGGASLVNFGGTSSQIADLSRLNGRTVVAGTTTGPDGTDAAVARLTNTGALDPSFGTGGVARADLGGAADEVNGALLRYQDGTVQVAGGNGGRAVLWGLTAAGTADTRLGDGGRTQLPFGQPSPALSHDAIVQPDGRVVVAATVGSALGLARLTADGRPDPTFGAGGYLLADLGNAAPAALALAPDGDIVVWGSRPCGDGCGFLARFQPDGTVDAGFGTGGAVLVYAAPGRRTSLLVQPDGAIVAVGTEGYGTSDDSPTFLGRWAADGHPDPTFGTSGIATTTRNTGRGVVRTDSGTLVVLTHAGPFCCTKLNAYDAVGQAQNTPAGSIASPFAGEFLAATPDGGFVVAGETQPAQTQHTAEVFRFDAAGRVVAGFGTGGMVTLTPDRSGTTLPEDIEVLADGRILVAVSHFPQNADPVRDALVLLAPDGSPDPTFGTGGVATLPGILTAPIGLAVQSPDRLIMVTTERPGDLATTVVQALTLDGPAPSSSSTTTSSASPPPSPPTTR